MPIAYLDDRNVIALVYDEEKDTEKDVKISVKQDDDDIRVESITDNDTHTTIVLAEDINLSRQTMIQFNGYKLPLEMGKYPTTPQFDETYATDLPMGPVYTKEST